MVGRPKWLDSPNVQPTSRWRLRYEMAESVKKLRADRGSAFWYAMAAAVIAMEIPEWLALFFAVLAVVALLTAAWAQWTIIEGERLLSEGE